MGSNDYHNGIISKDIAKRTCLDPLSYLEDIQHEEAKQVPKKRDTLLEYLLKITLYKKTKIT
ncbi:hypothetical protein GJV76_11230 [Myroides sp. BIT-d1]|uniref:Uncharacterized protein n=1 Tax=Myroides albus TaxID=2562892 RepID=A0A6I3LRA3_9FLAO|nr:hypothetical protein [Myroides albus]MTG98692.1 hypothetical protein [Myroides albus]